MRQYELQTGLFKAAPVSAAKPFIGASFIIFIPIVLIIRQPPTDVPRAIARAQVNLTQSGTTNSFKIPLPTSAIVIIPMDFWASFEP